MRLLNFVVVRTTNVNLRHVQDAAIECDYFQIAVLMNLVEYKKHKKLRNISSKMTFNIRLLLLKNFLFSIFFPYGSTALYGPGPPRFVEVS
jgi:hypothetical protein